jgi:hypothetical protein
MANHPFCIASLLPSSLHPVNGLSVGGISMLLQYSHTIHFAYAWSFGSLVGVSLIMFLLHVPNKISDSSLFSVSGFQNTNSQISACLAANGKYVISASEDSHVYVWKMMIHLNKVPVWEVVQGAHCPVHCHSNVYTLGHGRLLYNLGSNAVCSLAKSLVWCFSYTYNS